MTDTRMDGLLDANAGDRQTESTGLAARPPSAWCRDFSPTESSAELTLRAYTPPIDDPYDPELLRQEYESWFRSAGVETVTGRKFSLGPCPYTRMELEEAAAEQWIPVVSPKGLTAAEVATTLLQRKKYEQDGLLGLSLQRYMILAARLRYLTGQSPDFRWWGLDPAAVTIGRAS